ncbi:MAG: hypothetical protein PHT94_03240 [Candidatus Nanoarchaeia archaeon]|nr:hypothetical protein [Candidatus Nanoarchaeia archaeon]
MKKSQIQMIESIIALAFIIIIIFIILGVFLNNKIKESEFVEEVNHEALIAKIQEFQNLPDIKYSLEAVMISNNIDILKLGAFKEQLESKISKLSTRDVSSLTKDDINYLSNFYNIDFEIVSIYPSQFSYEINFSLIQEELKDWTPQFYVQSPVLIINDSNSESNYGIIKIRYFMR